MEPTVRIGIDIGGTFTDFVYYHPESGQLKSYKLPSTPHDPAEAVLSGLARLPELLAIEPSSGGPDRLPLRIVHGSTVATNALLERKGAPTGLVTTRGFRDILQIGRQNRPALYDLFADPPPPLVPERWRLEVDERVDHQGSVLEGLDPAQVTGLIPFLQSEGITSVAICLLFSFAHPEHEEIAARILREAGFDVSASSEVLPEFREFERTSTTVINAYVSPVMDRYLGRLEQNLAGDDLRIMQSNGGSISADAARRQAVRCILSGPAGGVVGATALLEGLKAQEQPGSNLPPLFPDGLRAITFDMGGTSTDVSLIVDSWHVTTEASLGGYPVRVPILDIHTVGSGGGSIATVDPGGALRVGPESAGAEPGPACYGDSDLPTVTDANLVLGRLVPEWFLGGELPLAPKRAWAALGRLGTELGLNPGQAAHGVIEVVNAHMERALRLVSVERGYDPREFTLVSFGGAGGLHAADLARQLQIPRVLIPRLAGTFSAFGMLMSDVVKDYSLTVMLPGDTEPEVLESRLAPLVNQGRCQVEAEGVPASDIAIERLVDLRYQDQSYELSVPFSAEVVASFHRAHQREYGYANPREPVTIVNLRVRAVGQVPKPALLPQPLAGRDPSRALLGVRRTHLAEGPAEVPFYSAEALEPGTTLPGPAILLRDDTTILVGRLDRARVDGVRNLQIEIGLPS